MQVVESSDLINWDASEISGENVESTSPKSSKKEQDKDNLINAVVKKIQESLKSPEKTDTWNQATNQLVAKTALSGAFGFVNGNTGISGLIAGLLVGTTYTVVQRIFCQLGLLSKKKENEATPSPSVVINISSEEELEVERTIARFYHLRIPDSTNGVEEIDENLAPFLDPYTHQLISSPIKIKNYATYFFEEDVLVEKMEKCFKRNPANIEKALPLPFDRTKKFKKEDLHPAPEYFILLAVATSKAMKGEIGRSILQPEYKQKLKTALKVNNIRLRQGLNDQLKRLEDQYGKDQTKRLEWGKAVAEFTKLYDGFEKTEI